MTTARTTTGSETDGTLFELEYEVPPMRSIRRVVLEADNEQQVRELASEKRWTVRAIAALKREGGRLLALKKAMTGRALTPRERENYRAEHLRLSREHFELYHTNTP